MTTKYLLLSGVVLATLAVPQPSRSDALDGAFRVAQQKPAEDHVAPGQPQRGPAPPVGQKPAQPPAQPAARPPGPPPAPPPAAQQPAPPPRPVAQPPQPPAPPPPAVRQQPPAVPPAAQQQPQLPQPPVPGGRLQRPAAQEPVPGGPGAPPSPPAARQQPPAAPPAAAQQQPPTVGGGALPRPPVQPGPAAPVAQPPAAQQQMPLPGGGAPAARQLPVPGALPVPGDTAQPAPPPRSFDQLRSERRQTQEGGRTFIQEGDRVIIREDGRAIIRHSEVDRFRRNAQSVDVQRRGANTVTVVVRPDGARIITEVDEYGRLVRRVRRDPAGREFIIIDNTVVQPRGPGYGSYFVNLPPPVVRIPRTVYIREAARATPEDIYETLIAPPVDRIERRYALDEIRYSLPLRERMARVDIDTVTFEFGSWEVTPDQVDRLAVVADAVMRAVRRNPAEVFLIEGHTDAVGSDVDNLSLSDRRAEAVAQVLTDRFGVPPENLTTQGYGEQYLKIQTEAPERANRRVTVRRITPLLTGQN